MFWQPVMANTGLAFLKIGAGARAAAMGEAYVAIANDATGLYWNPAGVVRVPLREVIFTHNEWFQGVSHDFIGIVFPRQKDAIGLSIILNNIDGLERRLIASKQPIAEFSAHDVAVGLSYARKFGSRLNLGITTKYLYEKIYLDSAFGFALDLGFQLETGFAGIVVAAAIHNIGTMSELRQESIKLPTLVRFGCASPLAALSDGKLLLAADIMHVLEEKTHLNLGVEYFWKSRIALRAGYQTGFEEKGISTGFGLNLGVIRFNYAFVPFDADLNNTHRLGLGLKF